LFHYCTVCCATIYGEIKVFISNRVLRHAVIIELRRRVGAQRRSDEARGCAAGLTISHAWRISRRRRIIYDAARHSRATPWTVEGRITRHRLQSDTSDQRHGERNRRLRGVKSCKWQRCVDQRPAKTTITNYTRTTAGAYRPPSTQAPPRHDTTTIFIPTLW